MFHICILMISVSVKKNMATRKTKITGISKDYLSAFRLGTSIVEKSAASLEDILICIEIDYCTPKTMARRAVTFKNVYVLSVAYTP